MSSNSKDENIEEKVITIPESEIDLFESQFVGHISSANNSLESTSNGLFGAAGGRKDALLCERSGVHMGMPKVKLTITEEFVD